MSIQATNVHREPSSSSSLLDATLSLARTQLVAQLTDETSVDGRIMGTLGFSGALLAADLAAKGALGGVLVDAAAGLGCSGALLFGADAWAGSHARGRLVAAQ
jgi:hypothetical protein